MFENFHTRLDFASVNLYGICFQRLYYSKSFPYTDFHYIDRYNMAAIPFSIPTSINEELLGDKRTGAMISQNQTDMTKLTQPVTLIILNFLSNLYIDIPKLLP